MNRPEPHILLVEPCCGSAALSFHVLGAKRALLPYQGSKWRFRRQISAHIEREIGRPLDPHAMSISLSDAGPFGSALRTVFPPDLRREVIAELRVLQARDPREVYDELTSSSRYAPWGDDVRFAAEFLFLQRLSFSGKAVGIGLDSAADRWRSPGFNATSAYGVAATTKFGAVRPMISSLVDTLQSYDRDLVRAPVTSVRGPALEPADVDFSCYDVVVVYLDPPYVGGTGYPNGEMGRPEVTLLAQRFVDAGAHVFVSESEPVEELVSTGWRFVELEGGKTNESPFKAKGREFLTYNGPHGVCP